MLLEINPENPQPRLISKVVETLKNGGVVAYPTDTTYGIGCSIFSKKGIERIYLLKQRERKKRHGAAPGRIPLCVVQVHQALFSVETPPGGRIARRGKLASRAE